MVNRGASRGCITCRQRRVKCDESKPRCHRCLRLSRECAGYGNKSAHIRFRDETARYSGCPVNRGTRTDKPDQSPTAVTPISKTMITTRTTPEDGSFSGRWSDYTILPSPPPVQRDLAVSFYLTYVTNIGRSLDSTRGFLEFIRPVLATERYDSALSLAVNALAIKLWARLTRHGVHSALSIRLLHQALLRLQEAVNDPVERLRDATVLAALVLQQHDTISAVFGQTIPHGAHREGALALLIQRGGDSKDAKHHSSLLANLLHFKVSLCVRETTSLPVSELEWLETQVVPIVPVKPSSLLDIIGVSVARLQYNFRELSSTQRGMLSCELGELSEHIQSVHAQLQVWPESVPLHWYPRRVQSGKDIDSSIETYKGGCDVYPSIQIANIWNSWRIYHLVLQQIRLRLACEVLTHARGREYGTHDEKYIEDIKNNSQCTHEAQEHVDSICNSVPFYLGNCDYPTVLSNISNPRLKFPSYHDLQPTDEAFIRYRASDDHASRVDHSRHVALHGPLHIMSILSHLIGLFAEDRSLRVARTLRQEREHWISDQFLRSLYLLRLIPKSPTHSTVHYNEGVQSQEATANMVQAEALARTWRRGLWTLTIL